MPGGSNGGNTGDSDVEQPARGGIVPGGHNLGDSSSVASESDGSDA